MLVTREQFHRSLEEVAGAVADPRAGIFGPDSKAWELGRESLLFLGGGRAALLQLAHPWVAWAVDQHSATRLDPRGRFERTFAHVFAMVFGTLPEALAAARRVHAVHARVVGRIDEDLERFPRGQPYAANDASALFWVHATLVDTVLGVYDRLIRPLGAGEREAYYQDMKRFAQLFGIPLALMPPSYRGFCAYMAEMVNSDALAVGQPARQIADFLFRPPHVALAPLTGWYKIITAGLLPPRLRRAYRFAYGARERVLFRASMAALVPIYRALPARWRTLRAYRRARRRIAHPSSRAHAP